MMSTQKNSPVRLFHSGPSPNYRSFAITSICDVRGTIRSNVAVAMSISILVLFQVELELNSPRRARSGRVEFQGHEEPRNHVVGGDHADQLDHILRRTHSSGRLAEGGIADLDVARHLVGQAQRRPLDSIE